MSETRLGVSITATDSASASITQLRSTIRGLQETLSAVGGTAADVGGKITNAINAEIASINREIAARSNQAGAINTVTAAIKQQTEAAVVLYRTLQQGIDLKFGVGGDRAIKSASDSARVLATSLSAAAEADARLRNEAIATAAALERQGSAVRSLSGAQFFEAFNRRQGLGQPQLSAASSAAAFQRELGPVNNLVATRSAAEFGRMTASLAGVKESYASAAASAKVFQEAGLTAAERALGVTEKQVIAAANLEAAQARLNRQMVTGNQGGGRAAGSGALGQEARHVVALFDEAASGRRGQFVGTLGASLRDAGLGATGLAASMGGLVAVMGTLSIARHAEALGKWATELRASAASAGMSVSQYAALQKALTMMGLEANEADRNLAELAKNLGTATAQPGTKMAEAFHNLGISQEQLKANNGDVEGGLRLLARAFAETADSANKSANFQEILGAAWRKLIPFMQGGTTGLDSWIAKAKAAGSINDEQARKLETLGEKVRSVGEAITDKAIPAFIAWAGPITTAAEDLKGLITTIGNIVTSLGDLFTAINKLPGAKVITDAVSGALNPFSGAISGGKALISGAEGLIGESAASTAGAGQYGRRAARPGQAIDGARSDTAENNAALIASTAASLGLSAEVGAFGQKIAAVETAGGHQYGIGKGVGADEVSRSPTRALGMMQVEPDDRARGTTRTIDGKSYDLTDPVQNVKAGLLILAENLRQFGGDKSKAAAAYNAGPQALERASLPPETKDYLRKLNLPQPEMQQGAGLRQVPPLLPVENPHKAYEDFAAAERLKIAEAEGSSAKILAIYDEWLNAARTKYKTSAGDIANIERQKVQEINKAQMGEVKEGAQLTEQLARAKVTFGAAQGISAGTTVLPGQRTIGGTGGRGEGTAALGEQASAIEVAAQKEVAALQLIIANTEQGSNIQKAAAQEVISVLINAKQKEVELYNKAAEASIAAANKSEAALTKVFDSFGSGFESFSDSVAKALLAPQVDLIKAGFTTIKFSEQSQELRAAAQKLMLGFADDLIKSLETGLSKLAASALSSLLNIPIESGGGLSSLLSSGVSAAGKAVGIGGSAASSAATAAPDVAKFGLAAAQQQTAATQLQGAATTLQTAATSMTTASATQGAGSGASAASSGTAAAAAVSAPIVAAETTTTAATTTAAATDAASLTTGLTAQTTALTAALATQTGLLVTATETGAGLIIAAIEGTAAVQETLEAATAVKPSALGFSYASGGIVPSAAGGMVVGGTGGSLAILHAQEMVLPAPLSRGLQEMIARGNSSGSSINTNTSLNYSPTINTSSRGRGGTGMSRADFQQMMALHSSSFLGEARNMVRSGWRPT